MLYSSGDPTQGLTCRAVQGRGRRYRRVADAIKRIFDAEIKCRVPGMSKRDTIENIRWLELRRREECGRLRRRVVAVAFVFVIASWALGAWLVLS